MMLVFSNRDDSLTLFLHQREALQRTDSKHHCIFSKRAQRCFNLSARRNSSALQCPCSTHVGLWHTQTCDEVSTLQTPVRISSLPPARLQSIHRDRALFASTALKNNRQTAPGLCKAIQGRNLLWACWIPKDAGHLSVSNHKKRLSEESNTSRHHTSVLAD